MMQPAATAIALTRRTAISIFLSLTMLWAVSATALAMTGGDSAGWAGRGGTPAICTDGCLHSITWE